MERYRKCLHLAYSKQTADVLEEDNIIMFVGNVGLVFKVSNALWLDLLV